MESFELFIFSIVGKVSSSTKKKRMWGMVICALLVEPFKTGSSWIESNDKWGTDICIL